MTSLSVDVSGPQPSAIKLVVRKRGGAGGKNRAFLKVPRKGDNYVIPNTQAFQEFSTKSLELVSQGRPNERRNESRHSAGGLRIFVMAA